MCGISGIFSLKKIDALRVQLALNSIAHRGPDGEGVFVNDNGCVVLGHRRLSIIDLSVSANQPMHFSNRYSIVYNGEIYNYKELKGDLEKQGVKFITNSDTEVVLAMYAAKGVDCLKEFDGMFAFAIYDNVSEELFCARDRFGEKPFYYSLNNNEFVFGSEIKTLFSAGIEKSINRKMLLNYLVDNYKLSDPNNPEHTFYNNVFRLEKASWILLNKDLTFKRGKYWNIDSFVNNENLKLNDAVERLNELLLESLKRRIRSDVPIGSSLSGGLDSSLVVGYLSKYYSQELINQKTFSARFKNFARDEGQYIQLVNKKFNLQSFEIYPTEELFINYLDKLIYHQEEPFPGTSIFAQFCVMQSAAENNVKVLLDGQGADEIFAGYEYFIIPFLNELARGNNNGFNEQLLAIKERYPNVNVASIDEKSNLAKKKGIGSIFKNIFNSKKINYLNDSNWFKESFDFINPEFLEGLTLEDLVKHPKEFTSLNDALKYSIQHNNLEDLLRFSDRNAMAFSVEVRLPYLSKDIVEFALSLPPTMKINRAWTKFILRESSKNVLPDEITWRKDKVGYETPEAEWFNNSILKEEFSNSFIKLKESKILNIKSKKKLNDFSSLMISKTLLA